MVGLNHELASELLWREFPSDTRASYFRQFWDTRGIAAPMPQLPPIREWSPAAGARRQLRRRSARRAADPRRAAAPLPRRADLRDQGEDDEGARHRGEAAALPRADRPRHHLPRLRPDRGRRRAAPRPIPAGSSSSRSSRRRRGSAWTRRAPCRSTPGTTSPGATSAPRPGRTSRSLATTPTVASPGGVAWAFNAAHMAAVLRQRPVRIAIHARRLLSAGRRRNEDARPGREARRRAAASRRSRSRSCRCRCRRATSPAPASRSCSCACTRTSSTSTPTSRASRRPRSRGGRRRGSSPGLRRATRRPNGSRGRSSRSGSARGGRSGSRGSCGRRTSRTGRGSRPCSRLPVRCAPATTRRPANARHLPDRFVVLGYQAGERVLLEAGKPIPATLPVGPTFDDTPLRRARARRADARRGHALARQLRRGGESRDGDPRRAHARAREPGRSTRCSCSGSTRSSPPPPAAPRSRRCSTRSATRAASRSSRPGRRRTTRPTAAPASAAATAPRARASRACPWRRRPARQPPSPPGCSGSVPPRSPASTAPPARTSSTRATSRRRSGRSPAATSSTRSWARPQASLRRSPTRSSTRRAATSSTSSARSAPRRRSARAASRTACCPVTSLELFPAGGGAQGRFVASLALPSRRLESGARGRAAARAGRRPGRARRGAAAPARVGRLLGPAGVRQRVLRADDRLREPAQRAPPGSRERDPLAAAAGDERRPRRRGALLRPDPGRRLAPVARADRHARRRAAGPAARRELHLVSAHGDLRRHHQRALPGRLSAEGADGRAALPPPATLGPARLRQRRAPHPRPQGPVRRRASASRRSSTSSAGRCRRRRRR